MKVAIQGERGAFSHQAALQLVRGADVLACATSAQVFDALDSRRAAAAVIPVENTLAGPVGEHLDLLLERDVFVHAEMRLRIAHNLIAAPGVKLKDIRQVLSHPVALDQCRNFFRKYRGVSAVPFYDTAGSVKHIMAQRPARHRGHRQQPGSQRIRRQGADVRPGGQQTELHPFLPDRQEEKNLGGRQQDLSGVLAQERLRSAVQGLERFCPAGPGSEQD